MRDSVTNSPPGRDHADEGWAHLDEGDVAAATAAHARAKEASSAPSSDPDIVALGAALTAINGDPEAGLAGFRQAYELPPHRARYLLHAAELELHALDHPEAASELCDQVFEVTTEEQDLIDAVILKAQALLSLGDHDDEAREVLAELDGCVIGDPVLLCQAGDLYLTLGDIAAADQAYGSAVRLDTACADGWHGLGLVHQARGDREAMSVAWQKTRQLDQADASPPWQLSRERFAQLAQGALSLLPDAIQTRLADTTLVMCDTPSDELVQEGVDPRRPGHLASADAFYLFQHNVERACDTPDQVLEELGVTLLYEAAEFFGLDEDELAELGELH